MRARPQDQVAEDFVVDAGASVGLERSLSVQKTLGGMSL